MKNSNWPRWIFASICKHFADRSVYPLFIEGQYRDLTPEQDRIELRTDGPYVTELNKNYYKLFTDVNILVSCSMNDSSFHHVYTCTGKVASYFTSVIEVYKFGNGAEDTGDFLGCLRLLQNTQKRERVQINNFGQIEAKTRLVQATVEGHYVIHLEGDE